MSQSTQQTARPKPVVLCILDGWGLRENGPDNAIDKANTPHFDKMYADYPMSRIHTAGADVGLPEGQMGNSEVGHTNIGAGRIVLQDLPRIDQAFRDGEVQGNPVYRKLVDRLKESGGTAHVMGLLSTGGVHSHQKHFAGLANLLAQAGIPTVAHGFLDGRDTPPKSAEEFIGIFEAETLEQGVKLGTVSGRYYAMDRDKRWDRVQLAYDALTQAKSDFHADNAAAAVEAAYARGETDEFVKPTVLGDFAGISDGDAVVMINFRADRAREILTALTDPAFDGFERARQPKLCAAVGMTEYSTALNDFLDTLFPPEDLKDTLGEAVSKAGLTQLRIAETEKYAHVTFFLNGGRETVFDGEERILVQSPKVATYDLQPEMSAPEVTDKLVEAVGSGKFDLIVVNYANPDMVGHTGVLEAAIEAVETVDACVARVDEAVREAGGVMLISADHGNVELMRNPETGNPHTAHTTLPVPLILTNAEVLGRPVHLRDGRLADLAPTVLTLMGLPVPEDMTGTDLLAEGAAEERLEAS